MSSPIDTNPLFSGAHQTLVARAAGIVAGNWFVAERLALRFTDFARTDLRYGGPTHYKLGQVMKAARRSGVVQAILGKSLDGWDPWQSPFPTAQEAFHRWYYASGKKAQGQQFKGKRHLDWWKTCRREYRRWAKALVVHQVGQHMGYDPHARAKLPFVDTGAGRASVLANAYPQVVKTRGVGFQLKIRLPLGHALNPKHVPAFRRVTTPELTTMAERIRQTYAEALANAVIKPATPKRGARAMLTNPQAERLRSLLTRGGVRRAA